MVSEAKPPILAAPLEIRHEIYRHTWTICKEYSDNILAGSPLSPKHEMVYFRLQVEPLHKLVSICRQIQDEVLSEYFHRTQVYLWYQIDCHGGLTSAMQHIKSSLLFASYTQHVSLHFTTDGFDPMRSTLDWLLQLKQLKTLELVIIGSCPHSMESALDGYFYSSPFQRLTTLRNLEKIVVKLCFWKKQLESDGDIWKREVERTPRLQKIKEILSESVREDLRQPEQQPTYVFEQHIGHGIIFDWWPLSYRI